MLMIQIVITIETDEDEDEVSSEKKISIDLSVDSGVNIDDPVRMMYPKRWSSAIAFS